jgi:hypothetical protein
MKFFVYGSLISIFGCATRVAVTHRNDRRESPPEPAPVSPASSEHHNAGTTPGTATRSSASVCGALVAISVGDHVYTVSFDAPVQRINPPAESKPEGR